VECVGVTLDSRDETGAHWQAKLPPNDSDLFAGSAQPRILRVTLYRHD